MSFEGKKLFNMHEGKIDYEHGYYVESIVSKRAFYANAFDIMKEFYVTMIKHQR